MARGQVPTLPPVTRTISFGALVREAWGDKWLEREVVYKFSNGREFRDSFTSGGPYTGTSTGT